MCGRSGTEPCSGPDTLDGGSRGTKHARMDPRDTIRFESTTLVPALDPNEVHAWSFACAEERPAAIAETARGALDDLLRLYSGRRHAPVLARGVHGKPFAPDLPELHFNISHAGRHVLLAFAHGQPLGVDLERHDRKIRVEEIAQRYFTATEAAALSNLAPTARLQAFLRLWTCKEAVLKATGEGLGSGLDRFEFELHDGGQIGLLRRVPAQAGTPSDWVLRALDPAAGLIGALAWRGPARRVRGFGLADSGLTRRSTAELRPSC